MSRLCAKPTCSDPAVRWFDILAAERRVVERSEQTPSSIPLCDSHAGRFSAPVGWTIESDSGIDTDLGSSIPPAPVPEPAGDMPSRLATALSADPERPRRRKHDRDAPWFLAGAPNGESSAPVAPLLPTTDDLDVADVVPTAGSLLHRAFHGPDRDSDNARAKTAERDSVSARSGDDDIQVADVGDLTKRRAKQAASDGYDIELPFPPFEPARHVAVS